VRTCRVATVIVRLHVEKAITSLMIAVELRMAGVDFAIEKGIAGPDRLGCCGLSYGGYMACWIVGQTDRFKAAVPENPVTNWVTIYGVSDAGVWLTPEEMGGLPHEIPEVYQRCSPCYPNHLIKQGGLRCEKNQERQ